MSEPHRHLGAGAAMSVLAQAGPLFGAAVLSIVLAGTIGPLGNGRYVLLATLVGITSMAASLGLHAGITYEVSRRRWSVGRAFLDQLHPGSSARGRGSAGWARLLRVDARHGVRGNRRRSGADRAQQPAADTCLRVRRGDPARARALRRVRVALDRSRGRPDGRRCRACVSVRFDGGDSRAARVGAHRRDRRHAPARA